MKKIILISGKAGCVDCDTEFFNGFEWKKIKDYNEKDLVLQYNKNGDANLVKPIQFIKEKCSTLNLIKNKFINQCLSDEHNVYYITSKGNLHNKSCKEVIDNHNNTSIGFQGKIITTFNYNAEGINLSDEEIKLMCAIICDASFIKDTNTCFFNFKKDRKKTQLRSLLNEINWEWQEKEYDSMPGYTRFILKAPRIEKEFSSYWYSCNNKQMKIICDNIMQWDGTTIKKRNEIKQIFSSTKKSTIDFLQFAYATQNKRGSIKINSRVGEKYKTNGNIDIRKSIEYELYITDHILVGMTNKYDKLVISPYKTIDNYKYCFSVPSGMLVLRRENNIFITGNSGKDTLAQMLKEKLESRGDKVVIDRFARYLKDMCKIYCGWNEKKDKKGREMLQYIGTDIIRHKLNMYDFHVARICEDISICEDYFDYVIIPDCRFPNEIGLPENKFKNKVLPIRINRLNYKTSLSDKQQKHPSEIALDNHNFDVYLEVSTLEDLEKEANALIKEI